MTEKIVLNPPFDRLWHGQDPFAAAFALDGEEFRKVKNRRTFRVEIAGQGFFVKLHRGVGWREIFKNLFQGKRPVLGADNEFLALEALHRLGVPTMETAAFGSSGVNPAARCSFLITRELTDVVSLEELGKDAVDPRLRIRLIRAVARSAGTMHRGGINHRDCYICHYLLKKNSAAAREPEVFVIDLHRAQIRERVPYRYLVKDVAGLEFSAFPTGLTRREALRFLRIYAGRPLKKELAERGRFWSAVERAALKLHQKEFGRAPEAMRPVMIHPQF